MSTRMYRSQFLSRRRIRAAMALKEMEQKDLASAVGVDASTISNILNGKQSPLLGIVERIARVLDMNIDDMYEDSEDTTP